MARNNQKELTNDLKILLLRFVRLHDQLKDELDKYYEGVDDEWRLSRILRQIERQNHEIYNLKGQIDDADELLGLYPEYDPNWRPRERAVVLEDQHEWLMNQRKERDIRQGHISREKAEKNLDYWGLPIVRKTNPGKGKSVLGALILGGIIGHSMKK